MDRYNGRQVAIDGFWFGATNHSHARRPIGVLVSLKQISARVDAADHALDRFKQNPFKQGSW
jgi:hypothetical protein